MDGNNISAIPGWALKYFFHLTSAGADFASCQDKEVIVDMTQSLDGEEAAAVVEDLVKADAMQWDMKLVWSMVAVIRLHARLGRHEMAVGKDSVQSCI